MNRRRLLALTAAMLVGSVASTPAQAESFPTRSVTLVNPYPAGGGADILARAVAKELSQQWGQPVIVENRPGAGTTIAAASVARAKPDGYTLLLSTTQHAVAPAIFKSLPYDYLTSFSPIGILSDSPFFLVVPPDRGMNNVNDLVAALKNRGGAINFASSGPGSLPHLAGALLNQLTGASATHIPYQGTAPAMTAVVSGQVDYLFADTSSLPMIQSGKAKAMAVSSASISAVLPTGPAVQETIRDFQMTVWTGLEAPAGTAQSVIDQVHDSIYRALDTPMLTRLFSDSSRQVVKLTPAQFAEYKRAEVTKYQNLARQAGLKVE